MSFTRRWKNLGPILLIGWVLSGCGRDTSPVESPEKRRRAEAAPLPDLNPQSADPGQTPDTPVEPVPGQAASQQAAAARLAMNFSDQTAASNIHFRHTDGGSGRKYIVETVVAGLALFDYDGDGWVDIYFLNGKPLPGTSVAEVPRNALYRNRGDGTFTDVTLAAGVGDTGYGLGVTVADYDQDGDPDLFVNNFGPNVFYINNGDGTFADASETMGFSRVHEVGAGTCFLDIEGDGDLDLYVGNYVDFTFDKHQTRRIGEYEYPAGPTDYEPVADRLYRNNSDGTWTDVSQESGIGKVRGPSMGLVSADFDEDGDVDVFVCCDNAANLLFQNDGAGHFQEVGLAAGVAYDLQGNTNGSMGVDAGDYNLDQHLDLFVTNYQGELSVLYRNLGKGLFADATRVSGAGSSSFPHVKWGTSLADFDVDGDCDLFQACGHFIDNIRFLDDRTDVRVPNFLLANQGDGTFVDVSQWSGSGLAIVECSKGVGVDDLDGDGDLDLVVLNVNAAPSLLRNDTRRQGSSFEVLLRGTRSNRDGVGARVHVVAGDRSQVAEVHSGRGYQSHYGSRLHFGNPGESEVSRIEVRWLGGERQIIEGPFSSRRMLIVENVGWFDDSVTPGG